MLFSLGNQRSQIGFSLIELLLVVAVIGILAAVSAPVLHDARVASKNAAAISNLRLMYTAEHNFYMQNTRYASLTELNSFQGGGLGVMTSATEMTSNGFTYQMVPPTPSAASLQLGFTIESNGYVANGSPAKYLVSANGTLQEVLPTSRYLVRFN
ncbi:MAG TPA: prepilin-type N-terminal cleavage/methylation domain-containing protein [Blastocatellia bacterium]|nr:prepilin-type N-terminal cleavage/methylation domain-containing protein [Blastocatellia bacterium]